MIYTLTANPAIDYNITCDALALSRLALLMATGANVVECPGLGDFAKVDEYLRHVGVQRVR